MWGLLWATATILFVHPLGASPLTTQLETTSLPEALTQFTNVAFNATARWQSNKPANFKMRISNGAAGSPQHLVTGGTGISWASDAPQAFTVNFDGAEVIFTIVDGAITHTIRATPALNAVNSLMIALRSQGGHNSSIELSDLKVNGEALSVPSAYLGSVQDARLFVLVQGLSSSFSLTGNMRITKTGGAQEIPSLIIFFSPGSLPIPKRTTSRWRHRNSAA